VNALTVRCRHDDGAEYIPTDDARVRVAPSSYASTTSLLVARKSMETVPHQHLRSSARIAPCDCC
jgi:hypothetical protein